MIFGYNCANNHNKHQSSILFIYYTSQVQMNIKQLLILSNGKLLTPDVDLTRELKGGCGADLMSDVLASIQPEAVLLTGLCNPQVVRTAQMADIAAIVFVRGKNPPGETIRLAIAEEIPLISTPFGMFEMCGRLFQSGMTSLESPVSPEDCQCE
jgi:hypothetical protein